MAEAASAMLHAISLLRSAGDEGSIERTKKEIAELRDPRGQTPPVNLQHVQSCGKKK